MVTRSLVGGLLTAEMTSTQVQLLFARALADQGLTDPATGQLHGSDRDGDDGRAPILVAWSEGGPEMTAADTRQFMALMAIAEASPTTRNADRPDARRELVQSPQGRLAPP